LLDKPDAYERMGIWEYYAYDPNQPPLPLSRRRGQRLFGWQRDRQAGVLHAILPDEYGRIWSPFLHGYLMPDGELLSLTDRFGNPRLIQGEAEKKRADAAIQRLKIMEKRLRELGKDPDQLV
jgi:hypothetical protein